MGKITVLKINNTNVQSICGKQISSIIYLKGKICLKTVHTRLKKTVYVQSVLKVHLKDFYE